MNTEKVDYESSLRILDLKNGYTPKSLKIALMRVQSNKRLMLQVPASTPEGKVDLINKAFRFLKDKDEARLSLAEKPADNSVAVLAELAAKDEMMRILGKEKDKIPLSKTRIFKINQLCSMMGVEANEENRNKVLSEVVDLVEFMASSGVLEGLKGFYSGENTKTALRWKSKDHFKQVEETESSYLEEVMLGGFEVDILRIKTRLSSLYKNISMEEYHASTIIALSIDVLYKLVGAMRSRGEKIFLAVSERSKFIELSSLEEKLWLRLHPKESTEDAQMYLLELWPHRIAE